MSTSQDFFGVAVLFFVFVGLPLHWVWCNVVRPIRYRKELNRRLVLLLDSAKITAANNRFSWNLKNYFSSTYNIAELLAGNNWIEGTYDGRAVAIEWFQREDTLSIFVFIRTAKTDAKLPITIREARQIENASWPTRFSKRMSFDYHMDSRTTLHDGLLVTELYDSFWTAFRSYKPKPASQTVDAVRSVLTDLRSYGFRTDEDWQDGPTTLTDSLVFNLRSRRYAFPGQDRIEDNPI